MAHPYSHEAQASQKARLKRLGATAGKSFGSSSMYKAKNYPSKGAGSSTPMTISGGKARSRPDRYAAGGAVGKKSRRPHATTNIIISHAGGRGGSGGGGGAGPLPSAGPVPVPVNRPVPVPVPVGAGGPPQFGPGGPPPPVAIGGVRPPMGPPPMPVGAGPGGPMPPMRPPGMKKGGAVKKAANGGFLKQSSGKGYKGYPNSPTTEVDDAVSAHKRGGGVSKRAAGGGTDELEDQTSSETKGYRKGGVVRKRQMGGGLGGLGGGLGDQQLAMGGGQASTNPASAGLFGPGPGRGPTPPIQGPPTISGRPARPGLPLTVPQPPTLGTRLQRPAPGTTVGYSKKGGSIHSDEKEDRKLFGKMYKEAEAKEEKGMKRKAGGSINPGHNPPTRGMPGSIYHQQGKGLAAGGLVKTPLKNTTGGGAGGKGRLAKTRAAKSVPDKTEL